MHTWHPVIRERRLITYCSYCIRRCKCLQPPNYVLGFCFVQAHEEGALQLSGVAVSVYAPRSLERTADVSPKSKPGEQDAGTAELISHSTPPQAGEDNNGSTGPRPAAAPLFIGEAAVVNDDEQLPLEHVRSCRQENDQRRCPGGWWWYFLFKKSRKVLKTDADVLIFKCGDLSKGKYLISTQSEYRNLNIGNIYAGFGSW